MVLSVQVELEVVIKKKSMARAKKNTQRSRQNVQFQVGVQCHAHDNPCCATWAPCLWVRCLLLRPAQIMEFKTAGNVRILIVVQGASIQCGGKLMPVISQILSEFCHFIRVMWETMYLIRLNEMLLRAHEICFERFSSSLSAHTISGKMWH